jgi:hypothetical protein
MTDNVHEVLDRLEPIIQQKNYRYFKLVDENETVIVPTKKTATKDNVLYFKHWNFIKYKLLNELPVGNYIIQCFYDTSMKSFTNYNICKAHMGVRKMEVQQTEKLSDYTTMGGNIDIEEYKKLLIQNAQLLAENTILGIENKAYKSKIEELQSQVDEAEPVKENSLGDNIQNGMSAIAPLIPAFEKWLSQRDRALDIQEKKLSGQKRLYPISKIKRTQPQQQQPKTQQQQAEPTYEEIVSYFSALLEQDEDRANAELDEVQKTNQEFYNRLVIDLDLEEVNENDNE